jgi:cyclophilin family peptidyl-prolyl cis-trans isomerase/HEAT repeat protein
MLRTPIAFAARRRSRRSDGAPLAALVALAPALAALATLACSSTPPPAAAPAAATASPAADAVAHLEERALLLMLADRRTFEPIVVAAAAQGPPELRRDLAVALGRIGSPQGLEALHALLFDADVEVRRAAAFALGELGQRDSARPLLLSVADADREVGALAVEALGKVGVAVTELQGPLGKLAPGEGWPRLLPYLFRFREPAMLPIAEAGLAVDDPRLHARAAYALAREPFPEALPSLRRLLADPDPWVRAVVARGLGIAGERADLAALRPLLDDPEPGPVVQALRSGKRLVEAGKGAAPAAWRERLLALLDDPRPGVAVTALEVAGAWLLDERLGEALAARARSGEGRVRELALLALAGGGDPRAAELAAAAASSADPTQRAGAAGAAALLPAAAGGAGEALLVGLAGDPEATVRTAAVAAIAARAAAPGGSPDTALGQLRRALADPDPVVRAAALDALAEQPRVPFEELQRASPRSREAGLLDARLSLVAALRARAEAAAEERGAIVAALEELARDGEPLVRRRAGAALRELGAEAPPEGPFELRRSVDTYRDVLLRTREPREVELLTARGAVRLRLACPQAPLTCLNFLQLANQGYFDGLRFHRVVPDFVVQDGDPRGDGTGGPGYEIRDEINRLRYRRGAVGMALSGPDTGGSQWFVALAEQPHLDGGYTAFGEVVTGMEVLDAVVQGERIERVREVARHPSSRREVLDEPVNREARLTLG